MGFYLNSAAPGALYKSETENPYFVDKSQLLEELIPFVQQGNKHIIYSGYVSNRHISNKTQNFIVAF